MNRIPKIIHYCWFGMKEKPKDVKQYIATWSRHLPDYELIEWNENNFNIFQANDYVREAYAAGKYAFVSDFVRVSALCRYGGIYLDTDVELLKPFDTYLEDADMVLGFESHRSLLTAFLAVTKNHPVMTEFLQSYTHRHFQLEDGQWDTTTINERFSALMETYGVCLDQDVYQELEGDIRVYPREYFCGFDVKNWHTKIGEKTCMVHHMASSWVSGPQMVKRKTILLIQSFIGQRGYDLVRTWLGK